MRVSNLMCCTSSGTLWDPRTWSIKSCGAPFQTVHHETGHLHNLSQLQVAACHMPVHIAPDHGATKLARRRLFLPVLHPGRLFQLFQLWLSPHHMCVITAGGHLGASSDNSGIETFDSGRSPISTTVTS